MALTTESAGVLVSGAPSLEKPMQTKTVRVLRAFYFNKKPTRVDEILDLPYVFALEMIAAHKAVPTERSIPQKPEPQKSEPQKGGRHAQ